VNGDGKPHLVAANRVSNTVSVLLGNGAGGFGARTDLATGTYPYVVAIGDLNADGKLDLSTANYVDGTVSVLLGNGVGGFGSRTDFATGSGPFGVAIGDLSGDGTPDLATANQTSNTVSVLVGNGNGSFAGRTDFCTGDAPLSVAIADLNGDGWRDLATANFSANTASVLLNVHASTVAVEPEPTRLPPSFQLLVPQPNPTRGTSTFAFALPEAARVRAEVFDIAGRRVARLTNDEILAPGRHSLTWDGRGRYGARVESGIYLVRVSAGHLSASRKLVIVSR